MEMKHAVKQIFSVALYAALTALIVLPTRADTLTLTNTPASNAVAEINRRLGVTLVFRSAVNTNQPVTISVDNPDTPDGRLAVVSALANALGLDFQKVFVVSKIDAGATVPEVKIDSDAPIIFPSTHLSARDAIQSVAAVDGALAQISGAVTGDVVLPSLRMRAVAAAATIAQQTQTGWTAYYGLFRRGQGPQHLEGKILDYTADGQPITELPLLTYRNRISTPAPITTAGIATATMMLPPAGPVVSSVPADSPFTASPYGFDPYSYSPYGYGYGGYGGYDLPVGAYYPGYTYTPGGAGTTGTGTTATGTSGTGTSTTTTPAANAGTVLPDFPYAGGVPGQVMIGGY